MSGEAGAYGEVPGGVELGVVLLDLEVDDPGVEVHLGDGSDGGADVVGGHGDVFGLGHDGDLLEFGDASGVGDVGLEDVNGVVVYDVGEGEFGVEALAGGDGDGDFAADFEEFADALFGYGLFIEEGVVFLEAVAELDGVHDVELGVGLDEDVDLGADGFADLGDSGFGDGGFALGYLVVVGLCEGVELHGGVAHVDDDFRLFGVLFGGAGVGVPSVGVDADFFSLGAAQQLVDGAVEDLAFEVPEGDVDAADGGHGEASTFAGGVVVHVGPDGLGVEGVAVDDPLFDEVGCEKLDGVVGLHGARVA